MTLRTNKLKVALFVYLTVLTTDPKAGGRRPSTFRPWPASLASSATAWTPPIGLPAGDLEGCPSQQMKDLQQKKSC